MVHTALLSALYLT